MLLEKPFAVNEDEMWELQRVAGETGRRVMICHVLRYAPFYVAVKERLLAGEIGDIINIQATEHVSYHHLAVSYIRGKWGNEEKCGAPMLLAKCCHDMDLIMWLKSGVAPRQVASFGSDFQFDPARSRRRRASGAWWTAASRKTACTRPKSITSTIRTAGAFMCGTAWSIWKSPPLRTRSSR